MEIDRKTDTNLPNTTLDQEGGTPETNQSRRHFAKSIAGSGVILSLASKPVMGSNYWCTGSGGMSGNTSSHGRKPSCLACSPGYWKTSPGTWPAPYYPYKICNCAGNTLYNPTKFQAVFGSSPYGDVTFMTVLQNQSGSREFHAIASLLNAARAAVSGLASAYTVSEVISLYKKGAPASTFSSTYEGSLHNCPLPNSNDNYYQAQSGAVFCNVVDSDGTETSTKFKCY